MSGSADTMYEIETAACELTSGEPFVTDVARRIDGGMAIGGVTLRRKLGEGGTGLVYLGWHERLRIPVAVKMLKTSCPEDISMFKHEARVLARVDHPNLIKVFDVDFDNQSQIHYQVMEYVNGASAYDLLQSNLTCYGRGLHETEAMNICLHTARALGAMHRQGVVHCDVKPDNILVRNSDGAVKLTDLGLASYVDQPCVTGGSVAGTIGFVSPEILRGKRPSPASDVYALGVSLYEMLVGELPYGSPCDQTYTVRQLTQSYTSPESICSELNEAVINIIAWSIDPLPSQRFANGDDMAEAIQRVLLSGKLKAHSDQSRAA